MLREMAVAWHVQTCFHAKEHPAACQATTICFTIAPVPARRNLRPVRGRERARLRFPMNQWHATPNQLTFLRLCMVPFLLLAVLEGHYRVAFTLLVIAGISDGLDGLLARLLKQQTRLGQYLDPVADKLLLSSLFLTLHHVGLVSRRVTMLVFARDLGILVVGAILFAAVGLRNFRPSIWGKANTLAQIVAVVAVLLAQFAPWLMVEWIRQAALLATEALACISGFDYAIKVARGMNAVEAELP